MTAPRVPSMAIDGELKNKLLFTALAIFIYRVGAHITSPTVDVNALVAIIQNSSASTLFSLYDALGGGLSRATIFALGIMPYISASIVFQMAGGVVPTIDKMQKDEDGRKKITQWTRYTTVAICRWSRPTASRCSSRPRARSTNPGCHVALHDGHDPHDRRDLRDVAR